MVDPNSPLANEVLKILIASAFVGLITSRVIHLAGIKSSGRPLRNPDRFTRIFNSDFMLLGLGIIPSVVVVGKVLSLASFRYTFDLLAVFRDRLGLVGLATTVVWWMHVVTPFLVVVLIAIGRRRRHRNQG